MTVRTYRVTPSLWLGDAPMCGASPVASAEVAVALIEIGEKVVLPKGAWDTARDVLLALGVDEDTASVRLYHAQYGRWPATV